MAFLLLLRGQHLTPVSPLPSQDRLLTQLDSEMDTTSSRLRATTKKASGWRERCHEGGRIIQHTHSS